jgi:very-short-patch-repair endonuclease
MRIYNLNNQKELRRQLRRNATDAERMLWVYLRDSQLEGKKFRRQHGIGKYILDFYCPEVRLAIELDGESHERTDQQIHDEERTQWLEHLDITVIRYSDDEVMSSVKSVVERIRKQLQVMVR